MVKKIALKLVLFLALLLVLDRAIAAMISDAVIVRQYDTRIEKIMETEMNYDILVFGSSRAARNIRLAEITKTTGLSAFNLGFPGADIDYHEDILRLVVEAGNKPKKILFVADDNFEVSIHPAINFRIDTFYPFLKYRKVADIICERGIKECIPTYVSHSYTQNINLNEAIAYYKEGPLQPDALNNIQTDGSMPIEIKSDDFAQMTYDDSSRIYDKSKESPLLLDEFAKFITLCDDNDIELIILFPPCYKKPTIGFKERIIELAGENRTFLDFADTPEFREKELYYDQNHLDNAGSLLFSKTLAKEL